MPRWYTRRAWGARKARGTTKLVRSQVKGVALHWPGMTKPIRGVDAVKAALRGWQNYHMDGHEWSDIAYNCAVDQDGNRYQLRGPTTRSAANGDTTVNRSHLAVLLILAPGEKPTPAMIAGVRKVLRDWRRPWRYPNMARRPAGHGDIRPTGPTECPGPAVQTAIAAGIFDA